MIPACLHGQVVLPATQTIKLTSQNGNPQAIAVVPVAEKATVSSSICKDALTKTGSFLEMGSDLGDRRKNSSHGLDLLQPAMAAKPMFTLQKSPKAHEGSGYESKGRTSDRQSNDRQGMRRHDDALMSLVTDLEPSGDSFC